MTLLTLLPDSLQKSKRVSKLKSLEAAQPGRAIFRFCPRNATGGTRVMQCGLKSPGCYNRLQPSLSRPTFRRMFDTIRAELTTGADKLAHLRRFL